MERPFYISLALMLIGSVVCLLCGCEGTWWIVGQVIAYFGVILFISVCIIGIAESDKNDDTLA